MSTRGDESITANDDRLFGIVSRLLTPKGYTVVEAAFIRTKDFNFKWKYSTDRFWFYVSDYLDDAPDIVLEQFVKGGMTFVFGGRHVFGKEYMEYMSSDEFILRKRPIFFKRSKRLTRSDVGQHRNLFDSVQRLMDRGLLSSDDIDNTVFSWSTGTNLTRLGYCAQLFRIVMISSVFDDPSVPEDLLDYVVYHECMHLRQGYRPFNRNPHDAEFHRMMSLYPDNDQMERRLREIPARAKH